jgi:hypothetical protein
MSKPMRAILSDRTSLQSSGSSTAFVPKRRKPSSTLLPDNLYESGGYFTWRHPTTGRRFGMGRDRAQAIDEANEANQFLQQQTAQRLVERLAAPPGRTLASFLPIYEAALDGRKIAVLTCYARKRQIKTIGKALGQIAIGPRQEDAADITRQCAEWLRGYEKAEKRRMAKALRSTLIDLFGEMAAAGWVAVNPAAVIRLQNVTVRRARLTLDDFRRIYAAAMAFDPWVQHSLELGLVSLQRREDIVIASFRDVEEKRLKVEQQKTGMRIRIPLSLRLEAVGWSLEEILNRCRDTVLSRHLVHHSRNRGLAQAGDPVHPQTITEHFRLARERAGIKTESCKTPPTSCATRAAARSWRAYRNARPGSGRPRRSVYSAPAIMSSRSARPATWCARWPFGEPAAASAMISRSPRSTA